MITRNFIAYCIVTIIIDCTEGSVRLVDGDNYEATAGRVEYCIGGLWGTVCNYMWSHADVAVVCQQLGLDTNPFLYGIN